MMRAEPDIALAQAGSIPAGSSLWHKLGNSNAADVLARFHCKVGASGRRYHFTRYVACEEIADFTNMLVFALDARGCLCAMAHVDQQGGVKQLHGSNMTDDASVCWDVRFLPQGREAADAIIDDLVRRGAA